MTTQQILTFDNTRISGYKTCPRFYLLRHMLHWESGGFKPPLVFGGAWHEGMAAILNNKDSASGEQLIEIAMDAFMKEWRLRNGPEDAIELEGIYPRTPGVANTMYGNWIAHYRGWLDRVEILETEEPFCVPLFSENQCPYCLTTMSDSYWKNNKGCLKCHEPLTEVYLVGRRDAVYRDGDEIWCLETKTSSLYAKNGGFQDKFTLGFTIDSQIDGYYYTTLMTHGSCAGVMVNACQTKKGHHDVFQMYPYRRDFNAIYAYFQEVNTYVHKILSDSAKGPEAFPRNSKACQTPYGFCAFHDVCRFNQFPWLQDHPQMGYEISQWEPFDEEELQKILLKNRRTV